MLKLEKKSAVNLNSKSAEEKLMWMFVSFSQRFIQEREVGNLILEIQSMFFIPSYKVCLNWSGNLRSTLCNPNSEVKEH